MSSWRWSSSSAFRWIDVNFSLPTSIFRWPRLISSCFSPIWSPERASFAVWTPHDIRGWLPEVDFSVVDTVMWSFITAFESVALVSMLCFFFVFCGYRRNSVLPAPSPAMAIITADLSMLIFSGSDVDHVTSHVVWCLILLAEYMRIRAHLLDEG
ncbi:hypothetical protein LguiB_021564 [Lonicera macranthoides]